MGSLTTYDTELTDEPAPTSAPRISYIRALAPAPAPALPKRTLALVWSRFVGFFATRWAARLAGAPRGGNPSSDAPGARDLGILCFETMGERLSSVHEARPSMTERVGSGFVLGAWLAALLACAAAFELAWTPPQREQPVPAAEPTEPEQSSPDPKPPAFDESTEPTPT